MAITNEIGGTAQFYVNGQLMQLATTANVDLGGVIRTPAVGLGGVAGFTTMIDPPYIEVQLFDRADASIGAVRAIEAANVQLNMNNGKSFILSNCFQSDKLVFDASKGTYTAKFTGFSCREVPAT